MSRLVIAGVDPGATTGLPRLSQSVTQPLVGCLCSGYGGLSEAVVSVFGGRLLWWADNATGPIAVMSRHHAVPNLGDVKRVGLNYTDAQWSALEAKAASDDDTFRLPRADWAAVPRVDVITAGYPCQPFSNAGKRKGTDDPRHLWPHIARGIGALRPRLVVLENVDAHLRRGFDVVLADLAVLGYDATWTIVRASDTGAPHRRKRLFVLAVDTAPDTGRATGPGLLSGDPGLRDGLAPSSRKAHQGPGGLDSPAADAARNLLERGWNLGQGWGAEYPERSSPAADIDGAGPQGGGSGGSSTGLRRLATRPDHAAVAHPEGHGRNQRGAEHAGFLGAADAAGDRGERLERWGDYADAIARWETVLGRIAPDPTTTGARGARVLSPVFVEWMMGLPAGHVTDTPGLSRNQMLTLLGNGVVPQQAELAIRTLLPLLEVS